MGTNESLQQMVLEQLNIHIPKNKRGLLPPTIDKNQLKVDQWLKVKSSAKKNV